MKLIYFYSKTCKQCRLQAEEFEKNPTSLELKKMWIYDDGAPCLCRKYRVTDVPTTVLVDDDGRMLHAFIDLHTTTDIEDWVARH